MEESTYTPTALKNEARQTARMQKGVYLRHELAVTNAAVCLRVYYVPRENPCAAHRDPPLGAIRHATIRL